MSPFKVCNQMNLDKAGMLMSPWKKLSPPQGHPNMPDSEDFLSA